LLIKQWEKERGLRKAIEPILIIRQFIVKNLWVSICLMHDGDMREFVPFLMRPSQEFLPPTTFNATKHHQNATALLCLLAVVSEPQWALLKQRAVPLVYQLLPSKRRICNTVLDAPMSLRESLTALYL